MVKVFNASNPPRRFMLSGVNGGTLDVRPGKFYDVPDEFTGDITYKAALACGDLKVFETTAEGEVLEKASAEGEVLEKASAEGEVLEKASAEGEVLEKASAEGDKPKARRGRGASLLGEEE